MSKYISDKASHDYYGEKAILDQIDKRNLHCVKTSFCAGYVSRKGTGIADEYNGRYGKGIAWYSPCWRSSQYCIVEYWIEGEKQ